MAETMRANNLVLPELQPGPMAVAGEGLRHPFVANAVANPVSLDQERRVLFLTGPK